MADMETSSPVPDTSTSIQCKSLPLELWLDIMRHSFTPKDIIWVENNSDEGPSKRERISAARCLATQKEWPTQLLRLNQTLHKHGQRALLSALSKTRVVYKGCTPLPYDYSNFEDVDISSLSRPERSQAMFERSYGKYVTDIKIYDFPAGQMELMNLKPFQKLQQITLTYDHVTSQKYLQEVGDEDFELPEPGFDTLRNLQYVSDGVLAVEVCTIIESKYHDLDEDDALVVGLRLKGCIKALEGMGLPMIERFLEARLEYA